MGDFSFDDVKVTIGGIPLEGVEDVTVLKTASHAELNDYFYLAAQEQKTIHEAVAKFRAKMEQDCFYVPGKKAHPEPAASEESYADRIARITRDMCGG